MAAGHLSSKAAWAAVPDLSMILPAGAGAVLHTHAMGLAHTWPAADAAAQHKHLAAGRNHLAAGRNHLAAAQYKGHAVALALVDHARVGVVVPCGKPPEAAAGRARSGWAVGQRVAAVRAWAAAAAARCWHLEADRAAAGYVCRAHGRPHTAEDCNEMSICESG